MDSRNETLNKRIRKAEMEKVPYVSGGGARSKAKTVTVRKEKGKGNMAKGVDRKVYRRN